MDQRPHFLRCFLCPLLFLSGNFIAATAFPVDASAADAGTAVPVVGQALPTTGSTREVPRSGRDADVSLVLRLRNSHRSPPHSQKAGLVQSLAAWLVQHPNDPEAAYCLAVLGGSEGHEAVALLRRAADAGFGPARATLGYMLVAGEHVPADPVTGLALLRSAASGGEPTACGYLGFIELRGMGVPKDLPLAIKDLGRAISLGDGTSKSELAYALVEANRWEQAEQVMADAGNGGDPIALLAIAGWREQGYFRPRDLEAAFALTARAAELDNAEARRRLGRMYGTGVGTSVDPVRAAAEYRLAAEGGDAAGRTWLARVTLSGEGVRMDVPKGLALLREAAAAKDADALLMLGRAYLQGLWVPRDDAVAHGLLRQAAAAGSEEAKAYPAALRP
ncbi:MAG: peptidase caspase catalytic subunit p20 [Phycisphaerales bacterium]|nr:peptidase caspase catalytic subunit p20 [Phycisphaerales bacterium]